MENLSLKLGPFWDWCLFADLSAHLQLQKRSRSLVEGAMFVPRAKVKKGHENSWMFDRKINSNLMLKSWGLPRWQHSATPEVQLLENILLRSYVGEFLVIYLISSLGKHTAKKQLFFLKSQKCICLRKAFLSDFTNVIVLRAARTHLSTQNGSTLQQEGHWKRGLTDLYECEAVIYY